MLEQLLKRRTIRNFLSLYSSDKWKDVIPDICEIAILNLKSSFNTLQFSKEEYYNIIRDLKHPGHSGHRKKEHKGEIRAKPPTDWRFGDTPQILRSTTPPSHVPRNRSQGHRINYNEKSTKYNNIQSKIKDQVEIDKKHYREILEKEKRKGGEENEDLENHGEENEEINIIYSRSGRSNEEMNQNENQNGHNDPNYTLRGEDKDNFGIPLAKQMQEGQEHFEEEGENKEDGASRKNLAGQKNLQKMNRNETNDRNIPKGTNENMMRTNSNKMSGTPSNSNTQINLQSENNSKSKFMSANQSEVIKSQNYQQKQQIPFTNDNKNPQYNNQSQEYSNGFEYYNQERYNINQSNSQSNYDPQYSQQIQRGEQRPPQPKPSLTYYHTNGYKGQPSQNDYINRVGNYREQQKFATIANPKEASYNKINQLQQSNFDYDSLNENQLSQCQVSERTKALFRQAMSKYQ